VDVALSFPLIQKFVFIPPHGLFTAIGFLVGATVLMREVKRRDISPEIVINSITWGAVGSIIGARADYVISHPYVFFEREGVVESLVAILRVWEGGLALFGGFIGGVLFALPTLIRARAHIPRLLDAAVPGFAIGVAVGRIGDLIIGDHLGDPVTGNPWWKPFTYTIRAGDDLAPGFGPSPAIPGDCFSKQDFFAGCSYHIPALYDLVGAALLFVFLMWLRRRWRFRSGQLACVWGIGYGAQRVLLDFTRSIDERPLMDMTGTQLLGVLLVTVCTALLVWTSVRGYGLTDGPHDPPSREGSLRRHAEPGDAARGWLADVDSEPNVVVVQPVHDEPDDDTDDLDDDEGTDESAAQSAVDSDASSTPSANPRA
jgi:phosphatidylglycerol:prolipoprotein diacylglycerol transferase